MKIAKWALSGTIALALMASGPAAAMGAVPAQMVITVSPASGSGPAPVLEAGDVTVLQGNTPDRVIGLQRLAGEQANMQLFVLLDDSTRSSSLGIQLGELKSFLRSLPATTQVAVGYMHNGTYALSQAFTTDHAKAAAALRLPAAIPGENGSPYFALSSLVNHWPSNEATPRRAVLMFTDGVDRYYSSRITDDPYLDAAVHEALKRGVLVYSVYLRGAGLYGLGEWTTTMAQSRLIQVGQETGGYAYFQGFTDPVSISPFLKDLRQRLDNQYQVTIEASNGKGYVPVKLRTELPGLKIVGPTRVYVR